MEQRVGVLSRRESPFGLAAVVVLLVFAGCGGSEKLDSRFKDRVITVDGKAEDWKGAMTYLEKADVGVGVINDDRDLYICIESWNSEVNLQVLNLGLTLWFDPHGGNERGLGIEYPMRPAKATAGGEGGHQEEARARATSGQVPETLAVDGPAPEERKVMALSEAPGLEVRAATETGALVYELRIPLRKDGNDPYAIGAEPGQEIGIQIRTPEVPPYREEHEGQGRSPGGGRGGGSGGRGGPGGHRGGGSGGGARSGGSNSGEAAGEKPRIPEPLKVDVRVHLAPAPERQVKD